MGQGIKDFCQERGINSLVHFTNEKNLISILENGLLDRRYIEKHYREDEWCFNDDKRLDSLKQTVSVSISFPNYKLFYHFRFNSQADWIVLELNPNILWTMECAFCAKNAAASAIRRIPLNERKMYEYLESMFGDFENDEFRVERDSLSIPEYFTTNPQAEVLALEPIPPIKI